MSTLSLLELLLCAGSMVSASPSPVSFEIQRRSPITLKGASEAAPHILARYTTTPTSPPLKPSTHLWRRVMEYAVGKQISVPLVNVQNQLFNCKVTFGNGQEFNMDLDTGSADTWVRGRGCKSNDGSCVGDSLIQDTTMTPLNKAFQTNYGSGAVKGDIYAAPVTIGPFQGVVAMGVATAEQGFGGDMIDGLMGLAFNSISTISKATGVNANFMDALFGDATNNMVSFYLPPAATDLGQVTFGGMDQSKFTGEMSFVPLSSQSYWQFAFTGSTFQVGGGAIGDLAGSFTDAIVDTGTTLMMIAAAPAAQINKAIGAVIRDPQTPGMAIFPSCETALQGPPLNLNVAGATYTIPASVYVIQDTSNPNGVQCFSGISGTSVATGDKLAILGDTFIRAVYTTFDKSRSRIGFAQSV